jgi:glutamate formiminotransferase
LDVHSDTIHHRSVLTLAGSDEILRPALAQLAEAAQEIDLRNHQGVHPRLGGLDVCPIVPLEVPMERAVGVAHEVGGSIYTQTGLPIYFYGHAALRDEARELRDIRRGGLDGLMDRARHTFPPDLGDHIDAARGVVCVGARKTLIAFNVNLRCGLDIGRSIAASVRESSGGLEGVRALAFPMDGQTTQISMNLTQPHLAGIDVTFEAIRQAARSAAAEVAGCEVVGLVPERFLPDPTKQVARLLKQPGPCLEARLRSSSS